jgi:hypothetical protein
VVVSVGRADVFPGRLAVAAPRRHGLGTGALDLQWFVCLRSCLAEVEQARAREGATWEYVSCGEAANEDALDDGCAAHVHSPCTPISHIQEQSGALTSIHL